MDQLRSLGNSVKTSITRYGVPVYEPKGEDIELCPKETSLNFSPNDISESPQQPNGHAPVSIENPSAAETPTTPTPVSTRGTPLTGGKCPLLNKVNFHECPTNSVSSLSIKL